MSSGNAPTWEEFITSGQFDAIEPQPLKPGDHVIPKEGGVNSRVEAVNLASSTAQINDGRRVYEYPIKDIRHTKDVTKVFFTSIGREGQYTEEEEGGGKLQWSQNWDIER